MNFYAKSKKHILKANEKEKVEKEYLNLIDEMGDILSKAEIAALENEKNNIINDVYEEQKTLREHLDETVECAERFFEQYGKYFTEKEKALIFTACKYHDVGKANLVFQANISDEVDTKYKNIKQIPHGFLSALTLSLEKLQTKIDDITNDDFKCLVTAVYYHHTRDDEFNADEIRKFSDNYFKDCFNEFSEISDWKTKMVNRGKYLFNIKKNDGVGIDEDLWHEYMLIKGMLNKFDWTVSSGKIESEENIDFEKKKLINNIDKRYGKNLRTVQQYMREKADSNVVIIAPTGSGKTEAALYWLNGEKGFYTLPLKVSSNAIYKRIREEYSFKDVALLHSESLQKYIEESSDEQEKDAEEKSAKEKFEKTKMFSAPLTISTVDQLFLFVYKALGTEIMAATLKYSKVIIDEIQSYEPRIVAALIYGLKTISQMGGKFAIMTATLPPVLLDFMNKYGLIKNETYCFGDFSAENVMQRHMIKLYEQEFNLEEIAEESKTKKVLVICNTVKKAQEIKFEKRVMHPPDNMINSLISYVNSLIYSKTLSEVYHTQLNPTISYLHEPGVRRYSLCLDISEVFKPLIGDRLIFSLLNRKQITEESFTQELNFLHLKKEASKLIVRELENSLKKTIKHKELGRQVSYQYLIRLELYKLIKHIIGEKEYEGFKIWW